MGIPIITPLIEAGKDAYKKLKSLPPDENEQESLREKQANVDAYTNAASAKTALQPPVDSGEMITPPLRYGDRPGEVRYHVNPDGSIEPEAPIVAKTAPISLKTRPLEYYPPRVDLINAQPLEPLRPALHLREIPPSLKQPMAEKAIPVYDKGGDVSPAETSFNAMRPYSEGSIDWSKSAPASIPQYTLGNVEPKAKPHTTENIKQPTGMPGYTPAADKQAPMPVIPLDLSKAPKMYDDGGDVVADDKHQLAILKEGEKVLSPEEADAYRARQSQGAPVDFPGRVLPEPKGGIPKIYLDGHPEETDTDKLTQGAKTNIDNAPLTTPKGDTSNPLPADIAPITGREISTKSIEAPHSGSQRGTTEEARAVSTDTKKAVAKGTQGLAQLGAAKIAADSLGVTPDQQKDVEDADKAQEEANKAYQVGSFGVQTPVTGLPVIQMEPKYGGPGQPVAQGQPIPPEQLARDEKLYSKESGVLKQQKAVAQAQYKQRLAEYDDQIDNNLKSGDLETAHRLQAAKMEYQDAHPWGTLGNHPGWLGKIGHVAGEVGNIAGNLVGAPEMALIPGTKLHQQVAENRKLSEVSAEAKEDAEKAMAHGKTPQEQTYNDIMTGGPNGGPRINPDTGQPFTAEEANIASQGTGKSPEELYIQEQMRGIDPNTGKHFTRAQAEERYLQMKAGNRPPNEEERRVNDYLNSRGLQGTPANREAARTALKASDTAATQQAALPFAEQKAKFNDSLATTRALLVQQNANASARGLKADELQNTENVRSSGVMTKLTTAKDALNASDEQFSNQIVPVVTLLSVTSAEGVKRVNKQELDKFVPTSGSFGRWIEAHADQFLNGQIPEEYRTEVGHMLDRMSAAEETEHRINTQSIDGTVRQGAQQPVQKPTGGAQAKPVPSKPQSIPTAANNKYHVAGAKGEIVSNDGKTWYTLDGKQVEGKK